MTTQQLRIDSFDRILSKLRDLFFDVEPVFVNRERISEQTKTPSWMVDKTLLVLCRQGFLIKKGNAPSTYEKFDGFGEVTPFQVYEWVTSYTQKALAKSRDKKVRMNTLLDEIQTRLNLESTPLERATESFQSAMEEYKYGFYSPDGPRWFTTSEEAATVATATAMAHGLANLDILQKVGKVVNQPQVMFY